MDRLRLSLTLLAPILGVALFGSIAGAAQPLPDVVGLVINEDGNSIAVLDHTGGRVVGMAEIAAGVLNKPHLAAFDPNGRRLYVGNKGANLAVFDLSNVMAPALVANVTPGGSGEIHRLAIAGGLVWLAHEGDSTVYAYDPTDFSAPAASFGPEQGFNTVHGLAIRPATGELWVTNRPMRAPGFVLRIDTRARSVVGEPLMTTEQPGDRPNNVAFTPDGRLAYVVNTGTSSRWVTVVDAARFVVVGQVEQDPALGLSPHAIAFHPATGRMFVANQNGGTVSAIDVATGAVLGYVPVGTEPHAVYHGPDGRIYAAAKKDARVTAIDPQTLTTAWELSDPALVGPHYVFFTAASEFVE